MDRFLILIAFCGFVSILHGVIMPSLFDFHFPMCSLTPIYPLFEYEYYQPGDIIIGGLFSVHNAIDFFNESGVSNFAYLCHQMDMAEYEYLMAFFFAIDDINKDPHILPNITLGYHLINTCGYNIKAIDSTLRILTGHKSRAPNYSSMERPEIAGFVGDTIFPTTLAVAELLNVYKYIQISHRVTEPLFSNRKKFPNFYRTVQTSWVWYEMVIKLLKYLSWNWVGIITSSDGTGEEELQQLRKYMMKHEICIEFVIYLTNDVGMNRRMIRAIERSTTEVIITCGHFLYEYIFFCKELKALKPNFTFILNESWNVIRYPDLILRELFNCSIIPLYPPRYIPGFDFYMDNARPSKRPTDPLLEDIWITQFQCLSNDPAKNYMFQYFGYPLNQNCTRTESIAFHFTDKHNSKFYFTYTAVYMLAQALNNMKLKRNKSQKYGLREKIQRYIQTLHFTNPTGENIFFNERGELPSEIYYANMFYYDTTPGQFKVSMECFAISETLEEKRKAKKFYIKLQLKGGKVPQAQCTEPCSMGFRKSSNGGIHACCYQCVPCSDGEISNVTDSEICHKCPVDKWPDMSKMICIDKTYDYLSFDLNIMTQVFTVTSILCSAVTIYILTLFILFRNTPIVKANNRNVSFILLTSILLSFLCIFLFLSRPVDITCKLRQVSFGVFFSIAVSSVLAKTITVCIAFKATKPNSYWRKWVGEKFSNYVVIICSSVQVLICVIWLSVSPPYQEYDMHSYPGLIIIQCNEGSVIGFYSMLGYMGFLAAVSFALAFMVRTLPDSFNEAKYITFSMLVFCSVWIAMIPAHLSTKGKYTVAVEIFAILASGSGLLCCIFFPKCYIIILKPERNSRKCMLDKS